MTSLDKFCHLCLGFLTKVHTIAGWIGCSCGVRRMEKEIISLTDLITSSGKYPERADSPELTSTLKDNGVRLINKVNMLFKELGIKSASLSSGFRPSAVNANTANAAKASAHMTCEAMDLILCPEFDKIDEKLLEKYDLYMENRDYTKSWVHLQTRKTKSGNRIFIP